MRVRRKTSISVPSPVQLSSGMWHIQLRKENAYVTAATKDDCIIKAKAIRAGYIESKKLPRKVSVRSLCDRYCADNSSVLSPSTINGYNAIIRTRFLSVMDSDVSSVDWQRVVNAESRLCSAKTLKNAWAFVSRSLRYSGYDVPCVNLPQVVSRDLAWLDFDEIIVFLDAVKGKSCELASLFALHGLRRSELLALTPNKVDLKNLVIHVQGSAVRGVDNVMVYKETNKNSSSRRDVPILIPRLVELLSTSSFDSSLPFVSINPNSLHGQINSVCQSCSLPLVGVHGLRRSFASLAYYLNWDEMTTMRIGGWSDNTTVRKVYTKLSNAKANSDVKNMRLFYGFTDEITDEKIKR